MKTVTVTAGIITYQDKILVAQRRLDKICGGLWEFPGGKIEPGETPQQCLKREIKEEFDIDIDVQAFVMEHTFSYETFDVHMYVYTATWNGVGTIKMCEHEQYQWASCKELPHFNWAGADVPVVKHIQNKKD